MIEQSYCVCYILSSISIHMDAKTENPSWLSFPITLRINRDASYRSIRNGCWGGIHEKATGGKKEANAKETLQLLVALREAICQSRVNKQPPRSPDGLMSA